MDGKTWSPPALWAFTVQGKSHQLRVREYLASQPSVDAIVEEGAGWAESKQTFIIFRLRDSSSAVSTIHTMTQRSGFWQTIARVFPIFREDVSLVPLETDPRLATCARLRLHTYPASQRDTVGDILAAAGAQLAPSTPTHYLSVLQLSPKRFLWDLLPALPGLDLCDPCLPRAQICRAYFKLEELFGSFLVGQFDLSGCTAVDCGAAPGG
jgi:hypothetical protein